MNLLFIGSESRVVKYYFCVKCDGGGKYKILWEFKKGYLIFKLRVEGRGERKIRKVLRRK